MSVKNPFTKLEWKEIKTKMRKIQKRTKIDVKGYRRITALHMRGKGFSNGTIGEALGYSASYITELVGKYKKEGMEAIIIDKRTSNNRRMSFVEERKFLEQFEEIAEAGQLVTIDGILKKFEELTEKESSTTTIYNLLKRHGWRKLKPRPRHPKGASEEEQESSKKNSKKHTNRSCWIKTEEISETNIKNTNA